MPTDVVLVHPPSVDGRWTEHLGLAYVAAALRQAAIRTQIVDAAMLGLSLRQTADLVAQAGPRVVGITATQPQARGVVAMTEALRSRLPQAHITAGGYFPTFCHDRLLRDLPALDSVVRGEGDLVFVDLVRRVIGGEDWRGLPGVSYRQNGTTVSNPPGPLVANLDELPFPARDTARFVTCRSGWLSMSSSRGCHGRCTFCSISAFYGLQPGPAWRARSPENMVEEMALLSREYGRSGFSFHDDTFIGPGAKRRERADAIADEILRRGLKVEFGIFSRADDVERELFGHLREAGLRKVDIGVESANQDQLNRFRKGTRAEDTRRAISILRDLAISFEVDLILMDPDCALHECLDTLGFIARERLRRDEYLVNAFADPFDGTELCERLRQQGRLRGSYLNGYSYSFRDPALGLCTKAIRSMAWLARPLRNLLRSGDSRLLEAKPCQPT